MTNSSQPTPPDEMPDSPAAIHRYLACEKCGKRMLVEIAEGIKQHRCPVCAARFTSVYEDGELSVIFTE